MNKHGSYDTPAELELRSADKLFGKMDFWFYLGLWGVVRRCNRVLNHDFSVDNWKKQSYDVFHLVERCGGKVHVSGIDNLRKMEAPFVYVSNHMSLVETFLLPVQMLDTSDIAIILKESLMKYPVFGKLLESLRPIVVKRKNPKEDLQTVLKASERVLGEEHRSILVFPQSTRTTEFNPADFNTLGVKLAQRNGVPVVPVALKTDFLKPGKLVRDLGPIDRSQEVYFKFGEPMEVTKANSREVHDTCTAFIASALADWRS
ncbi:hypothetical protein BVX97_06155 [bacterium E08(2017)]|nr:hypothetical protein BVX97_06155 [bacterium E08(2017)]